MPVMNTNASAPRRTLRTPINVPIDLTVTPPTTSYNASPVAGQIVSGEMVYLTTNGKIASLSTTGASNANAAQMVGVALDVYPLTYTAGVTGSPIPPGDPNVPMVAIFEDGDHLFNTTAADSYKPYDTVYLGADGRTISKTATGTAVGYVSPDQRQSNSQSAQPITTPITGAAGVQIYVRITPALAK